VRDALALDHKKLPLHIRKTLSFLRPYVENGHLVIIRLPEGDYGAEESKLLRLFTSPSETALSWFTDYQAAPLLENILPKPARIDKIEVKSYLGLRYFFRQASQ
jgi:hypothetical protein